MKKKLVVLFFVVSMFLPALWAEGDCQSYYEDCLVFADQNTCYAQYLDCLNSGYRI